MSAKILAFDPCRVVRPRYYMPIAMRGRLLQMPSPTAEPKFVSVAERTPSAAAAEQSAQSETARNSGIHVLTVGTPWAPCLEH
jgi:hypothetical protein